MQVDRGSFLVGFVLGLAVAAIVMAAAVALAPRDTPAQASSPGTAGADRGPGPAATVTALATATPVAPAQAPAASPAPTPFPSPTMTPRPPELHYRTVEVAARKFVVLEIPSPPAATLELTVQIDSDIDVTLFAPDGSVAAGPMRVKGAQTLREASASGGNWGVKIDNPYSWFTAKQVLLQYRLLSLR